MACLFFSFTEAQVRIINDYLRNGTRIIELEYEGVRYSIMYNNLSLSEQAPRMVIKNLVSNNGLEFKLPIEGRNVLELRYRDNLLLTASGQPGKLNFQEADAALKENEENEIAGFAAVLSEVKPAWPPEPAGGGEDAFHSYKIVGVSAGGTRSLAEHRCNDIYNGIDASDNCTGTTDCNCMVGQFLCVCVCGLFCE